MGKGLPCVPEPKEKRVLSRLRTIVHVPSDLPINQDEIEVIAALLEDWESDVSAISEAAE